MARRRYWQPMGFNPFRQQRRSRRRLRDGRRRRWLVVIAAAACCGRPALDRRRAGRSRSAASSPSRRPRRYLCPGCNHDIEPGTGHTSWSCPSRRPTCAATGTTPAGSTATGRPRLAPGHWNMPDAVGAELLRSTAHAPGRPHADSEGRLDHVDLCPPRTAATSKRSRGRPPPARGRRATRAARRRSAGLLGRRDRLEPVSRRRSVVRVFTSQNTTSRRGRHDEVELAVAAAPVAGQHRRSPAPRTSAPPGPRRGRRAPGARASATSCAVPRQSSLRGSSSTFTSLNVTTRTRGHEPAGRYMSHTQASCELDLDQSGGRPRSRRSWSTSLAR